MTKITLIGLMVLSILTLGSCSSRQPTLVVDDCVPDIQIETRYIPLDAWLTEQHKLIPVPTSGDNANLLGWSISCAINNNMVNRQLQVIRELER